MRAILIVPVHKRRYFLVECLLAKWYDNDTCTFLLQTQDKSFNERNTPVLANGTKAGCDPLVITPVLECVAPELLALIEDEVFRCGTFLYCTFDKVLN